MEVPAALLSSLVSGDSAAFAAMLPAGHPAAELATATAPTTVEPVAVSEESQLFAYYLTSDVVNMNEARALAGQPRDERMGDMYPSEWAAKLKSEAEKIAPPLDANGQPIAPPPVMQDVSAAPALEPNNVNESDVAAELDDEPEEPSDPPADEDAIRLAEEMTEHGIARCEHDRVNKCDKCGIERTRGVLLGPDGKPAGWKIAWRAIGGVESVAAAKPKKYDHIDFTPPAGVRDEAQKGLDWRKEHGRGGTAVGVARARDLSNGVAVSPETIRRMKAFFDRHEVDKKGEGYSPGEDGFPSAGRIAWAIWGGDPGYSWAKKVVKQMNAADENS